MPEVRSEDNYRWLHSQPLGNIPEGAEGSFAEVSVIATRYDDWEVQEQLPRGIFYIGATFVGGDFDQFRFVVNEGVTYLVAPSYKFTQRIRVADGGRNLGINFHPPSHHPF